MFIAQTESLLRMIPFTFNIFVKITSDFLFLFQIDSISSIWNHTYVIPPRVAGLNA